MHLPHYHLFIGFGDPRKEFWLGNDFIHEMTSRIGVKHNLLVYAKQYTGETEISKYGSFYIENESQDYTIHFNDTLLAGVQTFSGEKNLNGMKFHTSDRMHGSFCNGLNGPFWLASCSFLDPHRPTHIRWRQWVGEDDKIQEIQLMFKVTA